MKRYIEVAEIISFLKNYERFEIVQDLINRIGNLPTIEVSEDCISKNALRKETESENIDTTLCATRKCEWYNADEEVCESPNDMTAKQCDYDWENNVPSVAPTTEQSSIVHCKDCKHWNDFYSKCTKWTVDTYEQAQTNADDFCSYGERRYNE